MKKAEEYLDEFFIRANLTGVLAKHYESMFRKVQLDAIEYVVNKCAENAQAFLGVNDEPIVSKGSILKTIDQIKEEMK